MNNHDPDRVLFWKKCTGKKRINSYTRLGVGCHERHLLDQLLKPMQAIKQSTLELWQVC